MGRPNISRLICLALIGLLDCADLRPSQGQEGAPSAACARRHGPRLAGGNDKAQPLYATGPPAPDQKPQESLSHAQQAAFAREDALLDWALELIMDLIYHP